MGILLSVKEEKTRLSSLAEKMKFTATEASRQLQRLSEAKLIQRDSELALPRSFFVDVSRLRWLLGSFSWLTQITSSSWSQMLEGFIFFPHLRTRIGAPRGFPESDSTVRYLRISILPEYSSHSLNPTNLLP